MNHNVENFRKVDSHHVYEPGFVSPRESCAYMATVGKPDWTFELVVAFYILRPDGKILKELNKLITIAKVNRDLCIKFVPVDKNS